MRSTSGKFIFSIVACSLVFFCLGLQSLSAAPNTSLFESRLWDMNSGLPHSTVTAIAQTKDGFLWIGTMQGLARFDGVKFTTLDLKSVASNGVPSITALCAEPDGGLWIGTRNDGLLLCKNGKLTHYSTDNGLLNNSIRALLVTQDSLWIGTTRGLTQFKAGQFTHFTRTNGFVGDSVRCLYEDRRGIIWIIAGLGATQLYQVQNNFVKAVRISEKILKHNAARAIWVDQAGALWLGFTSGVFRHDSKGQDKVLSKRDGLADDVVSAFVEDRGGNLWIGTYGGLSRWFGGRVMREFNQTGVFFDQINVIMEDREGNIWLGTKTGLRRMTQTPCLTYSREHGLSHNNVMAVCETRPGGFWLATWGGGLNWMRDGVIDRYIQSAHGPAGLTSDIILSLTRDPQGQLWLGTDYAGGIFKMKFQTNGQPAFVHYGWKEGLTNSVVRVIHSDGTNGMWIGTQEGLVFFQNDKFTNRIAGEEIDTRIVREIVEDWTGDHWIGTSGGLSRFKTGQFKTFTKGDGLSDDDVRAIYCDKTTKEIWIGTANGGLNRLSMKSPDSFQFTAYTSKEGLWSDEVFEVVDDGRGFLWMSCLKGIFCVSKKEFADLDAAKIKRLNCRALEYRGSGTSIQCNGIAKPGGIRASDGRLLFATVKGVTVVDPNYRRTNAVAPPVVIEEVISDKSRVLGLESKALDTRLKTQDLNLKPGRGELEFHYTALSFQEPERVRFKYKLEGVDDDWVEAGNRRDAHYNNIMPGTYSFRVIACNNEGVWNETGASLKLTLQPHFWQTSWFYAGCGIAAAALIAGAARYTTKRRMQIRLQRLEQQHALEKERTRIARDMHDEIGARLTQISFLGSLAKRRLNNAAEAEKQIDTIAQTAREVVSALDEIVWTVDPRKDTLDNLATFLCRYASGFFQESQIICEFDLPPELPPCRLETDVRHNVFLAVKEALNNVLKHSGATRVVLQMRLHSGRLDIVISDNGKGFNTQPKPKTNLTARVGNGLGNMQQRLESIGGACRIESAPGKGTHLHFSIPLPDSVLNL